ncbi:MAG: hypothetical protein ACRCXT_22855, partial [Paraclostridium sp.]
ENKDKTEEKDKQENTDIDLQNTVLDLQQQIEAINDKNAKLLEQNQNLFLKLTGEPKETTKTDDLAKYKEYVGSEFFESLTSKQQKLLITILEGEDE